MILYEQAVHILKKYNAFLVFYLQQQITVQEGSLGRDRMVVGFTTTYVISVYH
jgi:hypothetical protein